MSSLIVKTCTIDSIEEHGNADSLEIAVIGGWNCVVQKNIYKAGDLIVYIPVDSVLTERLSNKLGVTKYLSNGRVRAAKLRGIFSFGIVINASILYDYGFETVIPDMDVADVLEITKYEPPIRVKMAGECESPHPKFVKYTDIENIKNFYDILVEGEEVVITEKIHGSNFRMSKYDGQIFVGSRNMALKENAENVYWRIRNALSHYDPPEGHQIFGEVYGKSVQKLDYGKTSIAIDIFDVMIDGRYLNFDELVSYCAKHKLPMVPVLFLGEWSKDLMSLASGNTVYADHIREGFVVRPVIERRFGKNSQRTIFKAISPEYLLKDDGNGDNFPH